MRSGISSFMIIPTKIFMIKKMVNGLATFIVMELWHKRQKEIYSKARFIHQGRNGIAGSYLKRRYNKH